MSMPFLKFMKYCPFYLLLFIALHLVSLDQWIPPQPHQRYDHVCFLTAHNAFSNKQDGWHVYKQQHWNIPTQLDNGIRGIMLDVYYHQGAIKLCHGNCSGLYGFQKSVAEGVRSITGKSATYSSLAHALGQIRDWSIKNPHEVVTIFLENYTDTELLDREIRSVEGFLPLILSPSTWNSTTEKAPWPTIGWMRDNNKRIVIFNEDKSGSGVKDHHLFWYTYDHVVESGCSTTNKYGVCRQRSESFAQNHKARHLYLLNYFGLVTRPAFICRKTNDPKNLRKLVSYCKQNGLADGKMPNFIALDFVNEGNGMQLVNEINHAYRDSSLPHNALHWKK